MTNIFISNITDNNPGSSIARLIEMEADRNISERLEGEWNENPEIIVKKKKKDLAKAKKVIVCGERKKYSKEWYSCFSSSKLYVPSIASVTFRKTLQVFLLKRGYKEAQWGAWLRTSWWWLNHWWLLEELKLMSGSEVPSEENQVRTHYSFPKCIR